MWPINITGKAGLIIILFRVDLNESVKGRHLMVMLDDDRFQVKVSMYLVHLVPRNL